MARCILPITLSCSLLLAGCMGTTPANLGATDGRLAPCPQSPNCVSSQSGDPDHAVEPLRFSGTAADALADLKTVVSAMARTRIVTATEIYLHAECTSALLRFVDDLEFVVDGAGERIHVRSASRLGHSDLGVNRSRVEDIRAAWAALRSGAPVPAR